MVADAYRHGAATATASVERATFARTRSRPVAASVQAPDDALTREVRDELARSGAAPTPDEVMGLTLELLAHDLRSPLSASRKAVDVLLQRHANGDRHLLVLLADALDRIGRMVDDSLGVTHLDRATGKRRIHVEELIESCVAASSCPERLDVLTVPTELVGDEGLLKPTILCLIENALRHSRTEVQVSAGPVDTGTLVMVDDDGPGIPAALRELVFRPMVRLDPDVGEGAGLGLALVRRVAELHGGSAWAEESAIGGARFCLWLP